MSIEKLEKLEKLENREILHKEIDIIQGCINRMASNSFLIKGWFITIFLGVFTFGYDKINITILIIILGILSIVAWLADAYFLQLERKYRKKYEWVIANRMTSNDYLYNLNPEEKAMRSDEEKISFKDVFFSKTLVITYGLPMLIYFLINIFILIMFYFYIKSFLEFHRIIDYWFLLK